MVEIRKYVDESIFKTPDDEMLNLAMDRDETGYVVIYYGTNSYSCNIPHINMLCDSIKKEYPDIKEEDIEVYFVPETRSIRHARFTTLSVAIPVKEFIKLRQENNIHIL